MMEFARHLTSDDWGVISIFALIFAMSPRIAALGVSAAALVIAIVMAGK